jgi:NTE family protein
MRDRKESVIAPTVLASVSDALRAQLESESETVRIGAGEWLFREGEPADSAYLVRSGRLEVVVERPRETIIRQLKRGAVVGELALLSYGVRSASVRASRDTELAELSRDRFEALMRAAPEFGLALVRVMATQIAANRAPEAAPGRPRTVAVIPLEGGAPAAAVARELVAALSRYGTADQLQGHPFGEREGTRSEFAERLARAEAANRRVLLTATSPRPTDPWTEFCLHEADLVLAVTCGGHSPAWSHHMPTLRGCELLVLGGSVEAADAFIASLAPREVQVMHDERARNDGIAQLARRLVGRALGLVLSGGGARALAHLGVLEELESEGIVVDRLAGASMGAIVSGLAATGKSTSEIAEVFQRTMIDSNPSNDYMLPAYSLIRGGKTRRALQWAFGDRRIEELPKRWYCVSSDLLSRELVVHRTGPMVDAIYPSMAIPGIYPPLPATGERLLVDGGVIDNLPVEPMARRAEGPIIAVDVSMRDGRVTGPGRPRLEPAKRRLRHLMTGSEQPVPRLSETILRTIALGSTDTVAAAMQHADIVISPRVDGVGLLDWKQLPRSREAGRRAARAALQPALAELHALL